MRAAREAERGRGLGLPAAGLLLAVAGFGWALWPREEAPDPNYVRARDTVEAYEMGKPEMERNYDDAVYPDALALLALVGPSSISADPAGLLAGRIKRAIEEFHARMRASQEQMSAIEKAKIERERAVQEAQLRARLTPDRGSPECKDEEQGHAGHDGHGH